MAKWLLFASSENGVWIFRLEYPHMYSGSASEGGTEMEERIKG